MENKIIVGPNNQMNHSFNNILLVPFFILAHRHHIVIGWDMVRKRYCIFQPVVTNFVDIQCYRISQQDSRFFLKMKTHMGEYLITYGIDGPVWSNILRQVHLPFWLGTESTLTNMCIAFYFAKAYSSIILSVVSIIPTHQLSTR